MGDTKSKELIQFATKVCMLEPVEFAGIAKILNVGLAAGDGKKMRALEEILSDLMDKFCELNRSQRRQIFQLLKNVERDRHREEKKTKKEASTQKGKENEGGDGKK